METIFTTSAMGSRSPRSWARFATARSEGPSMNSMAMK